MIREQFASWAMATRFEFVLGGRDAGFLRAAAEEAFAEIERIEARISPFLPTSQVYRANAQAFRQPVRLDPEVFELISRAAALSRTAGGAFDLTVGPLMRFWGFREQGTDDEALESVLSRVGMDHVHLDSRERTVRLDAPGVQLDFGAIGKGYALERAREVLIDAGIEDALLHGGTSTVVALGALDEGGWKVAVENPAGSRSGSDREDLHAPEELLAVVQLQNEAMSVSAGRGRQAERDGRTHGHVIDPRSGNPVDHVLGACVIGRQAADTDALSTALLVDGSRGANDWMPPGFRWLVCETEGEDEAVVRGNGITPLRPRVKMSKGE